MLCILSSYQDPYINIASEEYFLKNYQEEVFILYINKPSVVIGKHQNIMTEVNYNLIAAGFIAPVRRLSGGGAVYHDKGNINFCFINNVEDTKNLSYQKLIYPIIEAIKSLGIDNISFSDKKDIMIHGKKVSGGAMHVHKKRVLSHGTLLYNSSLTSLTSAISNKTTGRYYSKAVRSVSSHVANISQFLVKSMSTKRFSLSVFNYVCSCFSDSRVYNFSKADMIEIGRLAKEKYKSWEWIYGHSPKYFFEKSSNVSGIGVFISICVEKGVISKVNISINTSEKQINTLIEKAIIGSRHHIDHISQAISELGIEFLQKDENRSAFSMCFF